MVLLAFSMAPAGQGESLSAHVARILDVVDRSGVPYRLTPMGRSSRATGMPPSAPSALASASSNATARASLSPEGRLPAWNQKSPAVQGREGRGAAGAQALGLIVDPSR